MCLFPRTITTPFRRIARNGGQPLTIDVPCNKCAECKKSIRLQWHFRTYHECCECVASGGYILYDTLTYADAYLPKISHYIDIAKCNIEDFSCFEPDHIRLFLKRLRRHIEYTHKGVTLKYFLTSEYGADERYTHRPHYHVLFFVYPAVSGNNLHPYQFSRYISQCWQYGRTDGLPYQTTSYVSQNVFGSSLVHKYNTDYLKCCAYVSKYITKDSDFQATIDVRIDSLKEQFDDDTLKPIIRHISMFHRQSQGYGISYIDNMSAAEYDFIFNSGSCRIIDKDKVILTVPIPTYFKRKLFYSLKKDYTDGEVKYYWIPNKQGENYIRNRYYVNISKTAEKYKELISNLSNLDRYNVEKLLAGRTLEELAIYNLFYKGFSRDLSFLSYHIDSPRMKNELTEYEYNLYDWIENIINSKYINNSTSDDFYPRDKDNDKILIPSYDKLYTENIYPYKSNYKQFIFHEYTCTHFQNFDIINKIFESHKSLISKEKQKFFDHEETIQKRFKHLIKYGY